MRLVVDTNVLFGFFWKASLTRALLLTSSLTLITPPKAIQELQKYSKEIQQKTRLSEREFTTLIHTLQEHVKVIDPTHHLREARELTEDEDDSEFFSLCLQYNCPLWSNDALLAKQKIIEVISTKDVCNLLT